GGARLSAPDAQPGGDAPAPAGPAANDALRTGDSGDAGLAAAARLSGKRSYASLRRDGLFAQIRIDGDADLPGLRAGIHVAQRLGHLFEQEDAFDVRNEQFALGRVDQRPELLEIPNRDADDV